MTLASNNLSRWYIGTQKVITGTDAEKITAYASDTWTEITGLDSLGDLGDTADAVKVTSLDSGRTTYLPGTRDGGEQTNTVNYDPSDPGQIAFMAAFAANSPVWFNFKVVDNDAPVGGTPTVNYYSGIPTADPRKGGSSGSVRQRDFKVAICTVPLEVAAAPAQGGGT